MQKNLKRFTRQLRKNQTEAEKRLWYFLRNRHLNSYKFQRQYSIPPYIVDFICRRCKLIVEIDGGQHAEQQRQDFIRTIYLQKKGYKVLRFWNNEVLSDTETVLEVIYRALIGPHPSPLPEGEGTN